MPRKFFGEPNPDTELGAPSPTRTVMHIEDLEARIARFDAELQSLQEEDEARRKR